MQQKTPMEKTSLIINALKSSEENKYIVPGSISDEVLPVIYGTAEPGSSVALYNGEIFLAEVKVNAQGEWQYQPPAEGYFSGNISLRAEQNGQSSPLFNYTATESSTPRLSIDAVYSDVAGDTPEIPPGNGQGSPTKDATPVIEISAMPGSEISLFDNGTLVATMTADETGKAYYFFETPLSDGEHSFTVTSPDQTAETAAWNINVSAEEDTGTDPIIPEEPVTISSWALDNVNGRNYFQSGGKTDDSRPTFDGKAAPNQLVTLYDQNGQPLGSTHANSYGTWSLELTQALQDGVNTVTARTASQTSDGFNFTLETVKPEIPMTPVTLDDYYFDNVGATGLVHSETGTTDDTRPRFSGSAAPLQVVELYDQDGRLLGSTLSFASGRWQFEISQELNEGVNSVIARSGGISSEAITVTVDTQVPTPLTLDLTLFDNVGFERYYASGQLSPTDDNRPTFTGTAQTGEQVSLYDNHNQFLGSTV
ncbi:MAG: hypothetical protein HYZ77_06705, partial [Serratia liquefaciens]|nr:hypothetical protein [Serratia liquefaciens]